MEYRNLTVAIVVVIVSDINLIDRRNLVFRFHRVQRTASSEHLVPATFIRAHETHHSLCNKSIRNHIERLNSLNFIVHSLLIVEDD